jgi:TPR repeat protein
MKRFLTVAFAALAMFVLSGSHDAGADPLFEQLEEITIYQTQVMAKQGNTVAQLALAHRYIKGDGVEKNPGLAAKWLISVAKANGGYATYLVGRFYRDGYGVEKDLAEAYKWFHIGAEEGIRQSQIARGILHPRLTPGVWLKAQMAQKAWAEKREASETASK